MASVSELRRRILDRIEEAERRLDTEDAADIAHLARAWRDLGDGAQALEPEHSEAPEAGDMDDLSEPKHFDIYRDCL